MIPHVGYPLQASYEQCFLRTLTLPSLRCCLQYLGFSLRSTWYLGRTWAASVGDGDFIVRLQCKTAVRRAHSLHCRVLPARDMTRRRLRFVLSLYYNQVTKRVYEKYKLRPGRHRMTRASTTGAPTNTDMCQPKVPILVKEPGAIANRAKRAVEASTSVHTPSACYA